MAEAAFTQAFMRRFVEVERIAPTSELEIFDVILARIVNNPNLPERFPSISTSHPYLWAPFVLVGEGGK